MQTTMRTQPEDNQAAMAAQFAADVIVQRANASRLEWWPTSAGPQPVEIVRQADGTSTVRQVAA